MAILKLNIKHETKTTSFSGTLECLYDDELGLINDWRIELKEATIDLKTTSAWFSKPNINFKNRKQLFQILGLEQIKRDNRQDSLPISLNSVQIKKLCEYLNNKYDSTIYNIVGLVKGSNPSGQYKNPKAAQLWEIDNNYNITIFLENFQEWKRGQEGIEGKWNDSISNNVNNFLNDFPDLKQFFIKLQDSNGNKSLMLNIKKRVHALSNEIKKIDKDTTNAFNEFTNILKNDIINEKWIKCWGEAPEKANGNNIDRAHIVPRSWCKKQLLKEGVKSKKYDEYIEYIRDINNFIPLDHNTHNQGYDHKNQKVYWDACGKMVEVDKIWCEKNIINHGYPYSEIKSQYQECCLKYLKIYNKHVKKDTKVNE